MESVLIKVLMHGEWTYWAEAWGLDTVLASVEAAQAAGYRVWVRWPRDCRYLVSE